MQALKEKLEDVTKFLSGLSRTDVGDLTDAKNLKSLVFVIDRVVELIDHERCKLEQLKLQTLDRMSKKIAAVRPALEEAEARFVIRYRASEAPPRAVTLRQIPIDFAGVSWMCPLYADRTEVPMLSYGAVMIQSRPVVVFRYGAADWVSVMPSLVTDYSQDNAHTICCGNGPECEYGSACRYFHDPIEWPESVHQQRFARTTMVKKCPYFGHAPSFTEHAAQLTFENLRTLARYCAVQALMVHLVAQQRRH